MRHATEQDLPATYRKNLKLAQSSLDSAHAAWNFEEQHFTQPREDFCPKTVKGGHHLALDLVERKPLDSNPVSGDRLEAWKHMEEDGKARHHRNLILCQEAYLKERSLVQLIHRDVNKARRKDDLLPQSSSNLVAEYQKKCVGEQKIERTQEHRSREVEERRSVISHGSLYHDPAKVKVYRDSLTRGNCQLFLRWIAVGIVKCCGSF